MTRCAICGRKLTADKSVTRGIGPICDVNMKKEAFLNRDMQKQIHCEICGYGLPYFPQFDELKLPCNHFCCSKGHCPFAHESPCPRERVYIKGDIYPLYKHKKKECSFCGQESDRGYFRHFSKTKLTLECHECRDKNKAWRNNKNLDLSKTMSPRNLDIYIKNRGL